MEKRVFFVLSAVMLFFLNGCATIKDAPKGFLGISTRALEESRGDAVSKTFEFDYDICYNKTLEALSQIDSRVYAKDPKKDLVAVYVTEEDTTPIGFFFTKVEAGKTKVEIASPSFFAKERMARRIFAILSGLPDPEKKKPGEEEEKLKDKLLK